MTEAELKFKLEKEIAFDIKQYAKRFGGGKLIIEATELTIVDSKGKYVGSDYDVRFNNLDL